MKIKSKINTRESILFCALYLKYKMNILMYPTEAPRKYALNDQLLLRGEAGSHDFVAAADASHQTAGEHNAHYLELKQSHTRRGQ